MVRGEVVLRQDLCVMLTYMQETQTKLTLMHDLRCIASQLITSRRHCGDV